MLQINTITLHFPFNCGTAKKIISVDGERGEEPEATCNICSRLKLRLAAV